MRIGKVTFTTEVEGGDIRDYETIEVINLSTSEIKYDLFMSWVT